MQRVVLDLSESLRLLGQNVEICSLRGPGPLMPEAESKGIPVHAMPWRAHGADKGMFLKVARLIRANRYDVVHTHNTQAFTDGGLAAILARTPIRIHTDHARGYPDKWKYLFAEKLLSKAFSKVVAVSGHTLRDLRKHQGIAASRMTVIANGIDAVRYRSASESFDRPLQRSKTGLGRFTHVFGLGVRLEEQKGIRYLIQAMPEVVRAFPGTGLAIAGNGSLLESLKRQAAELGVADNVVFLGAFPDLTRFYPLLDTFILPSVWEGMPLCLLEAMSIGLPVIATDVGGVSELIVDGEHGYLVPAADPGALSRAMLSHLGNAGSAAAMGQNARRRFETRFAVSRMAKDYLDLYRMHQGKRPSAPNSG